MTSYSVRIVNKAGMTLPIELEVGRDALVFAKNGMEQDRVPYDCILKIVSSTSRYRLPGPAEGVDLQYRKPGRTAPLDVRMLAESEGAADEIVRFLVQVVAASGNPRPLQRMSPSVAGSSAPPSAQPSPVRGAGAPGPSPLGASASMPMPVTAAPPPASAPVPSALDSFSARPAFARPAETVTLTQAELRGPAPTPAADDDAPSTAALEAAQAPAAALFSVGRRPGAVAKGSERPGLDNIFKPRTVPVDPPVPAPVPAPEAAQSSPALVSDGGSEDEVDFTHLGAMTVVPEGSRAAPAAYAVHEPPRPHGPIGSTDRIYSVASGGSRVFGLEDDLASPVSSGASVSEHPAALARLESRPLPAPMRDFASVRLEEERARMSEGPARPEPALEAPSEPAPKPVVPREVVAPLAREVAAPAVDPPAAAAAAAAPMPVASLPRGVDMPPIVPAPAPAAPSRVASDVRDTPATAAARPSPPSSAPAWIPPRGPVRLGDPSIARENDLYDAAALRRVDRRWVEEVKETLGLATAAPGPSPPLAEHLTEDGERIAFLEGVVWKLSDQLARALAKGGVALDPASEPEAEAEAGAEDADTRLAQGSLPLPRWIMDPKQMSPLLAAYEDLIKEQEGTIRALTADFAALREEAATVGRENALIREELERHVEAAAHQLATASVQAASAQAKGPGVAVLSERVDLLTQENDLLLQQQRALEAETVRLGHLLEARDAERRTAEATAARAAESERALTTEASRLRSQNQALGGQVTLLREKKAGLTSELEAVRIEAERRRDQESLLDELERQCASLRSENDTMRQQLGTAEGIAASLSSELAATQDDLGDAARERDGLREENGRLRAALDSLQTRVLEVQRRDAETARRMREAVERTQQADLLHESLAAREEAMTREFESLRAQMLEQRSQLQGRLEQDVLYRTMDAEQRAGDAENRAMKAEGEAHRFKLAVERLERANVTLKGELTALRRSAITGTLLPDGSSALSLRDQLRSAQREADELKDRCAGLAGREQALAREVAVLRETHEGAVLALTRRLTDSEEATRAAQVRQGTLQTELSSIRRQLSEAADRQRIAEEAWRSRLESLRSEKDQEVRKLLGRLEQVEEHNRRLLAEAEHLVASKEAVSDQWRREAMQAAERVREVVQQAREGERARLLAVNKLEEQLTAVSLERASLSRDVEALKTSRAELEKANGQLKARVLDLEQKGKSVEAAAQAWVEERREFMARVDKVELSRVRAERDRDMAMMKATSLERQLKNIEAKYKSGGLGGAAGGIAAAGDNAVGGGGGAGAGDRRNMRSHRRRRFLDDSDGE